MRKIIDNFWLAMLLSVIAAGAVVGGMIAVAYYLTPWL